MASARKRRDIFYFVNKTGSAVGFLSQGKRVETDRRARGFLGASTCIVSDVWVLGCVFFFLLSLILQLKQQLRDVHVYLQFADEETEADRGNDLPKATQLK